MLGVTSMAYLEMCAITKTYPGGVRALEGVSLSVERGEVHALIGENGAGKSTLMKVLGGIVQPDSGSIRLDGREVQIRDPREAARLGIGMVHQHFMLFPSLTVAQNIVLGREPRRGIAADLEEANRRVLRLAEEFGLAVDPGRRVQELSVGERQRVEILKALYQRIELLILDEPTSVLTPQEAEMLFEGVRRLVRRGYTVMLVTHKLTEVLKIADRVTVLRRGRHIVTTSARTVTPDEIALHMVGRRLDLYRRENGRAPGEPLLVVDGLAVRGQQGEMALDNLSFEVRAGEIFGIAGVDGNGQSELEEAVAGLRCAERGRIKIDGADVTDLRTAARRSLGLAYIPADRIGRGSVGEASIAENIAALKVRSFCRRGMLNRRRMSAYAGEVARRFDVRFKDLGMPVSALSGGNIQKAILGRELSHDPKVLIASQPTRGLDIGAIHYVHQALRERKEKGSAVLLISTDLDEILALSDRIGVLYKGRLVAIFENDGSLTRERIGLSMLGAATPNGPPGGAR